MTTKPTTRHLTNFERQALADLFSDCDAAELLRCVAGLISHNVADFATSQDASRLIFNAANMVAKSERE